MVFASPYPDIEIPDVDLATFALERAAELGDKPALIDGPSGRTVTFAELKASVEGVAAGLAERGFGKGDVFALYAPNMPEYVIAFFGVAMAGGINTTINPLFTADELASQLNDSKARFLLTIPQFLEAAHSGASRSGVAEVFVLGEAEGATPFAELSSAGAPPAVDFNPGEDLVVLPYSSGTTGLPKGVMLTHRNLVANVAQCREAIRVSDADTVIAVLPFFHIYGMTVLMNLALGAGATVVTMPRFDLEGFLSLIQKHKVTRAYVVPPIVLGLAKHPLVDNYDLSSLEVIMSGAAPLGSELAEAAAERLGCLVIQGYGLTETSPVTHTTFDEPGHNKPGSIGPLVSNTEARITDLETGDDLDTDATGELLIKGAQVMKGYLNNEGATKATIDSHGWLHTGDLATADADGYFYIVDRLKELIKYKGYQVAPAELEALLLTHPAVTDAAVIPIPDEEAGEVPKAYVVTDGDVTAEEIMDHVASKVAPYKKLRALAFVDSIPKSASGKLLRRVLIDSDRGAQPR